MTTSPPPQPLPCPWCGTLPVTRQINDVNPNALWETVCIHARCKCRPACGRETTAHNAILAWNTRQPVVPVARLRELVEEWRKVQERYRKSREFELAQDMQASIDQLSALLPVEDQEKGQEND